MKIAQFTWNGMGWSDKDGQAPADDLSPQLTFIAGQRMLLEDADMFNAAITPFNGGNVVSCSTSGNIMGRSVQDDNMVATAIRFDSTTARAHSIAVGSEPSLALGKAIGKLFANDRPDLKLIYVIADGQLVNGSDLVEGIHAELGSRIMITGGLAGDDARFERTLVGLDTAPTAGNIVAIGLFGDALEVGCGTRTGWDPFGPERIITRSEKNVLYEIDGKNALELYKKYLGDRAQELPGSALLFPLQVTSPDSNEPLIRTILAVDPAKGSMTFAGNVPEGCKAQFMKANFERLIDGASDAAMVSGTGSMEGIPELALLVSCVGRKLILGQRVEEEIEEAAAHFAPHTVLAGFYSYGEIAPMGKGGRCLLHNQSMTITTLRERL